MWKLTTKQIEEIIDIVTVIRVVNQDNEKSTAESIDYLTKKRINEHFKLNIFDI